jgi:molybdopterin-guanine dinucleotide biosynthesis protein A
LDIGFIVLAGGKGLRLGQDKASETIGDRSLLERVVSRLTSFNSDILIVSASERTSPQLNGYPRLRTVADIYLNKGPLGGVYAGLKASDSLYNFVVACDMPFLNQALLRYMMQISAGFDLVVPRLGELVEPLHAVYSRACLAPIESLLKQGDLRLRRLFALVEVRYVEVEEIDRFDPQHLSFFNVNNEADMERAKKLARSEL